MDLDFSQDQELLRNSVGGMCSQFSSLNTLREIEGKEPGFSMDFWNQLIELGITGTAISEEYDGLGMNLLDLCIIYEEFGKNLAFSPHFVSCFLGANIINKIGSSDQKKTILPSIISGEIILTIAWLEPGSSFHQTGIGISPKKEKESNILSGSKHMVPYFSESNKLIVFCKSEKGSIEAYLLDSATEGISSRYQPNHAGESLFEVTFENVKLEEEMKLGNGLDFWSEWKKIVDEGLILIAAQASGGAEKVLSLGVEYSKEREAFGQPIGGFQSIAHYLADALVEVEASKLLCYQAAWAKKNGLDIKRLAPMAKMQSCKTFREVASTTIQIYGGLGFTVEADPQLFFRRAKHLQNSLWDNSYLGNQLSKEVLG